MSIPFRNHWAVIRLARLHVISACTSNERMLLHQFAVRLRMETALMRNAFAFMLFLAELLAFSAAQESLAPSGPLLPLAWLLLGNTLFGITFLCITGYPHISPILAHAAQIGVPPGKRTAFVFVEALIDPVILAIAAGLFLGFTVKGHYSVTALLGSIAVAGTWSISTASVATSLVTRVQQSTLSMPHVVLALLLTTGAALGSAGTLHMGLVLSLIPISGWLTRAVACAMDGATLPASGWITLALAFDAACIAIATIRKH